MSYDKEIENFVKKHSGWRIRISSPSAYTNYKFWVLELYCPFEKTEGKLKRITSAEPTIEEAWKNAKTRFENKIFGC